MRSSLRQFVPAAGLLAIGLVLVGPGAAAADETPPADAEPCVWVDALVVRGNASFTIGPEGCDGVVGPISFSAFELPSGMRVPLEAQELIAHHPANGSTYPEGSYSLTLDIGDPCNWQTDLYLGNSTTPVYGDQVMAADYVEGQVCVDETTTTTTNVEESGGPTTTGVAQVGGAVTTATTATTMVGTTVAATSQVGGAGGSGATLPQTGPNATLIIGLLGGVLVGLGTLARRAARA